MNDTVVRVENLGKRFFRGSSEPYHRLSEVMTNLPIGIMRGVEKLVGRQPASVATNVETPEDEDSSPTFWALKDLNFEVTRGEVVGIVGRNGAGKSTLLKVLTQITEPTTGRYGIKGRIGSMLEVGTGFHPELTGRENIYLNGTLLGMSRNEITRAFDEIVSFADIGPFLDTPVKRYSSGMYVRLGFSIAAHLQPEILIIDEVLAVGDAEFRSKCMNKMTDVARSGRTILFVSHNDAAVKTICTRCLWLEGGMIKRDGDPTEVMDEYYPVSETSEQKQQTWDLEEAPGDDNFRLLGVETSSDNDPIIDMNSEITIRWKFAMLRQCTNPKTKVQIRCARGGAVVLDQICRIGSERSCEPGTHEAEIKIPARLLNAGSYVLSFGFGAEERVMFNALRRGLILRIEASEGIATKKAIGILAPILEMCVKEIS